MTYFLLSGNCVVGIASSSHRRTILWLYCRRSDGTTISIHILSFIYPSTIHPSIHLWICPFIYLSIYFPIFSSIYPSFHIFHSVHVFINSFIPSNIHYPSINASNELIIHWLLGDDVVGVSIKIRDFETDTLQIWNEKAAHSASAKVNKDYNLNNFQQIWL